MPRDDAASDEDDDRADGAHEAVAADGPRQRSLADLKGGIRTGTVVARSWPRRKTKIGRPDRVTVPDRNPG